MRLLAIVHRYPPRRPAGAEMMLHAILQDLAKRGTQVGVMYPAARPEPFEGVPVSAYRPHSAACLADIEAADVLLTHLDMSPTAMMMAERFGKPLVHLVHNDAQLAFHGVTPERAQLVAYNSRWLQRVAARGPRPNFRTMVVRPHVECARYMVHEPCTNGAVTLVNMTRAKGAPTFFALAREMPHRQFLAVRGGYGVQMSAHGARNVTTIRTTGNIVADVYARTRVILMPSSYESWGRVAVEAACSAIPVIAAPTPGLREALGNAGVFAPLGDTHAWAAALDSLDDPDRYAAVGAGLRQRAADLERATLADLDRFAEALGRL